MKFDSLNVVDLLLDALCIVQADSSIVFVSPAFERIFGYTPEEAVGLRMLDLVHPEDLASTQQQADSIMQGQLQLEFENRYVRKDGRIVHIRWTARKATGSPLRVALAHDMTERRAMELRQAAVYAISQAAHATDDLAGLCARVHGIVAPLLASQDLRVVLYDRENGQLARAYPPQCVSSPCHIDDEPLCARVLRSNAAVLETNGHSAPPSPAEDPTLTAAGDSGHFWMGVPLPGKQGPLGLLVLQGSVSHEHDTHHDQALLQFVSTQIATAIESTRMRERLIQMAQFDALTGLPNRALLRDRLAGALARARRSSSRVSLLFLDLDRLKEVNDSLGHAAGDALLQQAGQRLTARLRDSDTVARIGGDEFVVLLEGRTAAQFSPDALQRKIAGVFLQPFELGEPPRLVTVRASVGMARFPEDGQDQDALMRHADAAMYKAKQGARPRRS